MKGKPGQNWETVSDENQKDEDVPQVYPIAENSSDKENKSEAQLAERVIDKVEPSLTDLSILNESNNLVQDDTSDEGWQEAVPKGRLITGRKLSSSRRPTLAKLNTNFMNVSQSSRYRGKPANFSSPRTSSNESSPSVGPSPLPVPKKFVKSASFSPKLNSTHATAARVEKSADSRSAPNSPALSDHPTKSQPIASAISVQTAGKLFSYKEVALAPPGTIVKAVAEQSTKGNLPDQQNPETSNQVEEEHDLKPIDENRVLGSEEETGGSVHEGKNKKEAAVATDNITEVAKSNDDVREEVVEVKPQEVSSNTVNEKKAEAANITAGASESTSDIVMQESCPVTSLDSCSQTNVAEDSKEFPNKDESVSSEEKFAEGDNEKQDEPPSGNEDSKSIPSEGEKQDETESGKETTKKLSAAAQPFNPSTPGFKDHGGILPPPANIAPMIAVNHRRSPHQSATARVPYGPRISGGYNRYGNRIPRNKTAFHTGDLTTDGNCISPPTIMNPHATEFVPGQPWVPNGYPVPPNGFMPSPVSPNGFPLSPNGIPLSPNGYPASLNGIPVTQNGFPTSPTSSTDPAPVENVGSDLENKSETQDEESKEETSVEARCEKQENEQNSQEDQSASNENGCETEEKPTDKVPEADSNQEEKETSKDKVSDNKPTKCWGDYSDGEAEMIEVTS